MYNFGSQNKCIFALNTTCRFIVYLVTDLSVGLCNLGSVIAGLSYSIAIALNHDIKLEYYGQGNATLLLNGTGSYNSSENFYGNQIFQDTRVFTKELSGELTYRFNDFIDPKIFYDISCYTLASVVIIKMLSSACYLILENKLSTTEKAFLKEYIFNFLNAASSSLSLAFLTNTVINIMFLCLHPYGSKFIYNVPNYNGIQNINSTLMPKNIISTSENFLLNQSSTIYFNFKNHNNQKNIILTTDIYFEALLDLIFGYAARANIVNEGKFPPVLIQITITISLFALSRLLKNFSEQWRTERIINSDKGNLLGKSVDTVNERLSPIILKIDDDYSNDNQDDNSNQMINSVSLNNIDLLNNDDFLDEKKIISVR